MVSEFKKTLYQTNLSSGTVELYYRSVRQFDKMYGTLTKRNLLSYKGFLLEHYKPRTVNVRILAINKFLEFANLEKLKLKMIRVQQRNFLENVISDADYKFLKNKLRKDNRMNWYFVVRFLAATGARVSELVEIKVEHVKQGYVDIYGKGGKMRRLYIARQLCVEAGKWLDSIGVSEGYLFTNRYGKKLTTRGIGLQLKTFAAEYGMDTKVVYPHSFRHRFAKNFLEKYSDIALLADLMGHESIETTRIYLRRTAAEQQEIVDKVVTW